MRSLHRLFFILSLIGLGLFLYQCGTQEEALHPPDPDQIIASAGHQTLTARDFLIAFQESQSFDPLLIETQFAIPRIINAVTETLFFERDLAQKAKESGLDQRDDFKKAHETSVQDELYQKVILEDVLLKIHITDKDLRQYYDDNHESLYLKPETNQLVFQALYVEYGESKRSREEAEALAMKANQELAQGGDFETVAKTYSDAEPHLRGKETSFNIDLFGPEVAQRLQTLADGETTGVFEFKNRFWIYKRIRFIESDYFPFDVSRNQILRALTVERTNTGVYLLTQELRTKHTLLTNPDWLEKPDQYDSKAIVLTVPGVYELTLGEFLQLSQQQKKNTPMEQKAYLDFIGNKAVCLAEALSRGWNEKDVALPVDFWDTRRLAKDYIQNTVDTQVLATEALMRQFDEQMHTFYENNRDRLHTPTRFDLSRLFFSIQPTPNMPYNQLQLLQLKAKAQATMAREAMEAGMPFDEVAVQFSQTEDVAISSITMKDITLNDLSSQDQDFIAPSKGPSMQVGEISDPKEIMNLTKERYGFEIFYLRGLTPSRPMTYEEAREIQLQQFIQKSAETLREQLKNTFFQQNKVQSNPKVFQAIADYLLKLAHRPDLQSDIARYEQSTP